MFEGSSDLDFGLNAQKEGTGIRGKLGLDAVEGVAKIKHIWIDHKSRHSSPSIASWDRDTVNVCLFHACNVAEDQCDLSELA